MKVIKIGKTPKTVAECIAEIVGTFLILVFGTSVVAAKILLDTAIGQWELSILWGLAVSWGVYVSAGISGGHLNPAVTLSLAAYGRHPWWKVPLYWISQLIGGFLGAAFTYLMWHALIKDYESLNMIDRDSAGGIATAGIFSTYPATDVGVGQAFLIETIITAILVGVIGALTDDNNGHPNTALTPLLIGLLVASIGVAFGPLTGFALNPARDLGPKCFTAMAGWGKHAFTGGLDVPYFIVPLFAPMLGGLIGGSVYILFIEPNTEHARKQCECSTSSEYGHEKYQEGAPGAEA